MMTKERFKETNYKMSYEEYKKCDCTECKKEECPHRGAYRRVPEIDGGLGLVKIFLLRFLKIHVLKNTLTPIHDHVRKNKDWSDTQVVFRFVIIQVMCVVAAYVLLTLLG